MKALIFLVILLFMALTLSACTWDEWDKTIHDPAWGTLGGGAPYTPTPSPAGPGQVVPSDEGL